jgi:integrase
LGKDTSLSKHTTLRDAVDAFISEAYTQQKAKEMRPRTFDYYVTNLNRFESLFKDQATDDFTRPLLKQWFESLPTSPESTRSFYRAVRRLFRWCAEQDPPLIKNDPTVGLKLKLGTHKREIATFTPEQANLLIQKGGQHKFAYALGLYAGIRPEEIAGTDKPRLDWSAIKRQDRMIRIPEHIAKTGRVRILEGLSDKLWDILSYGPPSGPISATMSRSSVDKAKKILNLKKWPQDCLRHSFATYDLAMHGDISRTSLLLGHEGKTSLLFTRYRGVRTKAEAVEYFKYHPSA